MSQCRSCGAEITWAKAAVSRKPIPVDKEPVENGNLALERIGGELLALNAELFIGDFDRYQSHFASCPNASTHRKA